MPSRGENVEHRGRRSTTRGVPTQGRMVRCSRVCGVSWGPESPHNGGDIPPTRPVSGAMQHGETCLGTTTVLRTTDRRGVPRGMCNRPKYPASGCTRTATTHTHGVPWGIVGGYGGRRWCAICVVVCRPARAHVCRAAAFVRPLCRRSTLPALHAAQGSAQGSCCAIDCRPG